MFGGYHLKTRKLTNTIEVIDHTNPKISPSLYELAPDQIPALTGSFIGEYDENTLIILGGKARKFNS